MARDPDCVFCKVAAGELPSARVAETDRAIAFMDVGPIAEGHTLVVPREHYESIADAPPAELAAVYELAARIAPALVEATGAEGLNVLLNNGRCAGQLVMHLHVHLVPRRSDDGLAWSWPAREADPEDLGRLADRIAAGLGAR
jgi:histidine triad (HIT) family protein